MNARSVGKAAASRLFRFRRGFSLIELVTVIAIVAIIAVFAAPRLADRFAEARAFYDRTTALLRLARVTAVSQRRPIFVRVDSAAGTVSACYNAAGGCTAPPPPAGRDGWAVTAPGGVGIAPTVTFQFDALGRYLDSDGADPSSSLSLAITGDASYTIAVERETGYVR